MQPRFRHPFTIFFAPCFALLAALAVVFVMTESRNAMMPAQLGFSSRPLLWFEVFDEQEVNEP
jgi:hypothetical protein